MLLTAFYPLCATSSVEEIQMLTASDAKIKEKTIEFAHYFTNKDADAIGALLSNAFSLFDPSLKWIHGKEAALSEFRKQFEKVKKVSYEIVHAYEDGEVGILEFKITLDQQELTGVDFLVWENGKLKELRCYYNPPNPPQNDVLKSFSAAAKSFVEGAIYEHYKGKRYKILSVGRNSENLEESVIYQALYGERDVWVRPLGMFLETIVIDGQTQPRFKRVQ